ncbi:MAG: hypothetical protein IPH09_16300, partial [bacterium]|nr:hypothetical protein [bacterium]
MRKTTCEYAVYYGFVTATADAPATLDVRLAPGTPVWVELAPSPFFDPGVAAPGVRPAPANRRPGDTHGERKVELGA